MGSLKSGAHSRGQKKQESDILILVSTLLKTCVLYAPECFMYLETYWADWILHQQRHLQLARGPSWFVQCLRLITGIWVIIKVWWLNFQNIDIYIYTFLDICGLPGTALCSTKSNITTPTTTQDRRAARAITSSADIFSFPRNPLRKPVCRAAAPFDPVAAKKERERKRN